MSNITIDLKGEVCPMPVLKTKMALEKMLPGQILEIIVDYPPSKENIERFVTSQGNEIIGIKEEGTEIRITVKKVR